MKVFDVIVVGLGPAGSSAAYTLARAGHEVLVVDKDRFPRYKSCGGCMSVKVPAMLGFSVAEAVEDIALGAVFTYKSARPIEILSERPVGHNVMRDKFDALLAAKAKEAGAIVIEGKKATALCEEEDGVTLSCADGALYKARFLIGADGASGFIGRRYFGLEPKECAVSITAEVPYAAGASLKDYSGRLFIDFGGVPSGYGWIFPKEKCLSVGIAGDAVKTNGRIKDYFRAFVESHGVLNGLMIGKTAGWTVPSYYDAASVLVKSRTLIAGDSGHLVDPFLGEGIYYAIKTGVKAAEAVCLRLSGLAADLSVYQEWLEKELYPELRACGRLSSLVYNHPRLWYSIIEKEPEIMLKYYNVIRGEEGAGSFHDWLYAKVASKPWKVIRRWVESAFLPA
ncbi:MAG: geranylgeranyl reductase family protein [Deltaproteobacteria bacterium]|nr:geranylgeranyl reductase family protein [Deltaproteobacteria bacterium]